VNRIKQVSLLVRYFVIGFVTLMALAFDAHSGPAKSDSPINSIHDIAAALRACWISPGLQERSGIVFVVRVSFRGNGAVLGTPFLIFQTPDVSMEERAPYKTAVDEMLRRCTPLHFSSGLAAEIAGHPINLRIIEGRGASFNT
jgi:hypothetical protein